MCHHTGVSGFSCLGVLYRERGRRERRERRERERRERGGGRGEEVGGKKDT